MSDDNIITLHDENGQAVDMELLTVVDYQDEEYVVLLPVDEEDDEVLILRVEDDAENENELSYVGVDDEEILEAVYAIFKERFRDEFDFADEDEE